MASVCLLVAWFCASGALLDVAQVFAWTRMFASYARTESVVTAAGETFDPAKPCAICQAVSKARNMGSPSGAATAAAGLEKRVLILERAAPFVASSDLQVWPTMHECPWGARCRDVPVPPPRGRFA